MTLHFKDRIFIILPSNSLSGSIKGVFAITNVLVNTYEDKMVFKIGNWVKAYLDRRTNEIILKIKYGLILKFF